MNKKTVILIVVFFLFGGVLLVNQNKNTTTSSNITPTPIAAVTHANTDSSSDVLRMKLLTNIVVTVPETSETINITGEQGDWSEGYVLIGKKVASLPNGAVVANIEVNSGGNARDIYLAVFEPGENAWQMTDAALLGDFASNAEVEELTTDMDTIYVTYNTYGNDMTSQADEKTNEQKEIYLYKNSSLELLEPTQ